MLEPRSQKFASGFSLMELIVYIALLGGLSVFVAGAFISVNQGSSKAQARYAVDSNIRYVLNSIDQDVKDANDIESPIVNFTSSTLTLQIGPDEVIYSLSGGRLRRSINGATSNINITSDDVTVSSISFRLFENLNIPILKNAINLNTSITIAYDTSSPDYAFQATLSRTSFLEKVTIWPARGQFGGSTGGGNTPPCVSVSPERKEFGFIRFWNKAYAAGDPCLPEGVSPEFIPHV